MALSLSSTVEHSPYTRGAAGSNPAGTIWVGGGTVYTPVLGTGGESLEGSNPSLPT